MKTLTPPDEPSPEWAIDAAVVGVVPGGVVARLLRLRREGYRAVVMGAPELTPSEVAGCSCPVCGGPDHPAQVVLDVEFDTRMWTFPAQRLTNYRVMCCWRGAAEYLNELRHDPQFHGVTIGVPR